MSLQDLHETSFGIQPTIEDGEEVGNDTEHMYLDHIVRAREERAVHEAHIQQAKTADDMIHLTFDFAEKVWLCCCCFALVISLIVY